AGRLAATDRACDLSLGLGQVWRLTGEDDPEHHLVTALDGAVATGDRDTGWRARYELGCWLGFAWDRRGEALAHFETAARDAGLLGDVPGQVESLCRWALLLANELDLTAAIRQADRAVRLVGELGDEVAMGGALDVRKLCALFLGELDLFEDLLPGLTDVLHRHDQLWTVQFVLAEAALVASATGRGDDAAARQAQAFEVNRRCGDRISAPYLVSTAGRIERGHGACGTALDLGREAVASAAAHRGWWEPWARTELGITLLEVGQRGAAIEQLERGAAAGLTSQVVRARAHLAMARWRAGDRDCAVTDLRDAERLLGRAALPAGRAYLFGADATLACAAVRLARGETAAAERLVAPVLAAAESSGWAEPWARALLLLARVRALSGGPPQAVEMARRALDVGVRTGLPVVALAARAVLAGLGEPDGPGLLARARADVVELSGSLNGAQDRRCFVESALAGIDELAGIIPPTAGR
ncbi:MAG: hypothetical protein L0I24_24460, partial [Pseudonocardia sp.]|nr:hypothetical protein [Pseudonocardia sp.]